MSNKRDFTHSEIQMGKDCLQKWEYRYSIGWRRKVISARTLFGSVIHTALEKHYWRFSKTEIIGAIEALFRAYIQAHASDINEEKLQAYFDAKETCKQVYQEYRTFWNGWNGNDFNISRDPVNDEPMIEYEFRIPVFTPFGRRSRLFMLRGKVDLVVEQDGQHWVVDHKTRSLINPSAYERLVMDQQAKIYCLAIQVYTGLPIAGFIYNLIRTKPPQDPSINKNGEVSLQKCDCSLDRYLEILERQDEYLRGLSPEERKKQKKAECIDFDKYAPEVARLREVKFFERKSQEFAEEDYKQIQMEIYQVTKMIHQAEWFYKNDAACDHFGGCVYRPICMGLDPGALFEIRPDNHDELSNNAAFHEPVGRGYKIGKKEDFIQTIGFDGLLEAVNA